VDEKDRFGWKLGFLFLCLFCGSGTSSSHLSGLLGKDAIISLFFSLSYSFYLAACERSFLVGLRHVHL